MKNTPEKWKTHKKHTWKVKSTWKAHLESEKCMKSIWKPYERPLARNCNRNFILFGTNHLFMNQGWTRDMIKKSAGLDWYYSKGFCKLKFQVTNSKTHKQAVRFLPSWNTPQTNKLCTCSGLRANGPSVKTSPFSGIRSYHMALVSIVMYNRHRQQDTLCNLQDKQDF